jgi:hypothetical protein
MLVTAAARTDTYPCSGPVLAPAVKGLDDYSINVLPDRRAPWLRIQLTPPRQYPSNNARLLRAYVRYLWAASPVWRFSGGTRVNTSIIATASGLSRVYGRTYHL